MSENPLPDYTLDGLLGHFAAQPEVKGIWYHGKEVTLDGFRFVGCRFDGCKLYISSTNFVIDKCFIDDSTIITYGGNTGRIVKLFNSRYQWFYENMPGFAPVRNADGTISIT